MRRQITYHTMHWKILWWTVNLFIITKIFVKRLYPTVGDDWKCCLSSITVTILSSRQWVPEKELSLFNSILFPLQIYNECNKSMLKYIFDKHFSLEKYLLNNLFKILNSKSNGKEWVPQASSFLSYCYRLNSVPFKNKFVYWGP